MLGFTIKREKKNYSKLTNKELEKIYYPLTDGTFYEGDNKDYVIGHIIPPRSRRFLGFKPKYFVLEIDKKDSDKYRILRRTDDEKSAIFSLHNAATFDLLAKDFKLLRQKKQSKRATMDRTVRRRRNRAKDDPILKVIWSCDLKPTNQDSNSVWLAKRSLASVRPNDLQVIIWPETYELPA